MSKRTERLSDRLARIGDEAEAGEADQTPHPITEHTKASRGNPRNKVLQVRLNPDEYAAIERIAKARALPSSTIAREALLKMITDEVRDPLVGLIALASQILTAAEAVAAQDDLKRIGRGEPPRSRHSHERDYALGS